MARTQPSFITNVTVQFCPSYQHLLSGLVQCSSNWQPQGVFENGSQTVFLYYLKPCKDFSTHSEQKPNTLLSGSIKIPPALTLFILSSSLTIFLPRSHLSSSISIFEVPQTSSQYPPENLFTHCSFPLSKIVFPQVSA